MPRTIPQLTVKNVSASVKFYGDALEFVSTLLDPPDSPDFAVLENGDASLYLVSRSSREQEYQIKDLESNKSGVGVRIYLEVDNAEAVHAKIAQMGIVPNRPLSYNKAEDYTEFSFLDLDGYEIGVYS